MVLTSVIGTVILAVSPSGSMEKQVRFAVSLVILIMLVRPLTGLLDIKDTSFKNNGILNENASYASDDYFVVAFKNELNNKLVELIENEGINVIETEIEVSVNDEILVSEKSRGTEKFKTFIENPKTLPKWLEANVENYSGKVIAEPSREDIDVPVNETLIVELYSK